MKDKTAGKVYLVGAGPGDPGLFTLKGLFLLKNADVVVYDSLVGQGVLSQIPDHAELINVGKRASSHTMPQEKINQLLVDEAKKGKDVVRLKGGDPFLFGRGGEEVELLVKEDIPYEIVPGVTSSLAVPAYNGIPVTHRDYCSSVHIITGHKKAGDTYDIDFDALVRTRGTLVFLMGVHALGDICDALLDAGMEKDMPAALLSRGTTSGQKKITATVSTLKEKAAQQGVETPAVIVVGRVCELAGEFEWYEKLPLSGMKVVVTRPRENSSVTSARLRLLGAEVVELPAISTAPLQDQSQLLEALKRIHEFDWIVFTSPIGVRVFFKEMKKAHMDIRSLYRAKVAAIGQGTKKELEERGLFVDLVPPVYDGATLGKTLCEACTGDEHILLPRAKMGSREILEELSKKEGLDICNIPIYDTFYEASQVINEKELFESEDPVCAVFTSASTVRGFAKACEGLDFTKVTAACIGKQTKAAADELGMKTYMAQKAAIDSLVDLVVDLKKTLEMKER